MDNNQEQQQQVFQGDFGDLEADEDLDWLDMDYDWVNPEMPVLQNQQNVLLPEPPPLPFLFPIPNAQGEFEGTVLNLLPQEQEQQPPEGEGFFYDQLGYILTEFSEPEPDYFYPINQQEAFAQDEETGDFIFAPQPY